MPPPLEIHTINQWKIRLNGSSDTTNFPFLFVGGFAPHTPRRPVAGRIRVPLLPKNFLWSKKQKKYFVGPIVEPNKPYIYFCGGLRPPETQRESSRHDMLALRGKRLTGCSTDCRGGKREFSRARCRAGAVRDPARVPRRTRHVISSAVSRCVFSRFLRWTKRSRKKLP
jgi:hypothetical protein